MVDRSKFKSYNCGLLGQFSNQCIEPIDERKSSSTENIDYKKKYFKLLKQKKRAINTTEKVWAADRDDLGDDLLVNIALMAKEMNQKPNL